MATNPAPTRQAWVRFLFPVIYDYMRDPNRIPIILKAVEEFWKENPDWRLGQLVDNVAADPVYYVEDEDFLATLNQWRENMKREVPRAFSSAGRAYFLRPPSYMSQMTSFGKAKVYAEAAKCDLLCGNCHCEVEQELRESLPG